MTDEAACGGGSLDRSYCDETSDCGAGSACCTYWPLTGAIENACAAPSTFQGPGGTYQGCPSNRDDFDNPGPQLCNPAKTGECLVPGATCVADSSGRGWCQNP
jgi:hypothetical protein